MDEKLIIKKIQALCHDPAEKALILGRIGHEGRAKEIMGGIIDEAKIPSDVKKADHIASAADRINLPKDERHVADFLKNPVIIHPLSGKQFNLGTLQQMELIEITSDVDRAVVYLADKYKENGEQVYLALWRELSGILINDPDSRTKIGQLWEILPADTRIPDHSIWEHKRVTSAIAGAFPNAAFLLFSIGPVQDFIATARKTQDLWAGSYLLSWLSWSAMKVVADEFGPDSIIFPDLCGQPFVDKWLMDEKGLGLNGIERHELSSPTLPNRFLAIIPRDAVRDIGERAKKAVRNAFVDVCRTVQERVAEKTDTSSEAWDSIWQRQTEGFIETYWSAVLVKDDYKEFISDYKEMMGASEGLEFERLVEKYEDKCFKPNIGTVYGRIYRMTEKALGSRKALREFDHKEEPNFKCTLCGMREPVHPGTYKDKNDNDRDCREDFGALRGFWQDRIMPEFQQIKSSERLCVVCLSKRLCASVHFKEKLGFTLNSTFPSVSMVSTALFKEKIIRNINDPGIRTALSEYIKYIQDLFAVNEERMSGSALPMVAGMCGNRETVEEESCELARKFADVEGNWLFGDSFSESLKEELPENDDIRIYSEAVQNSLKNLMAAAGKLQIRHPSKYYAVILMDGDDMGKWLAGDNAPDIKDILHPDIHLDENWDKLKKQKRPLNPSLHLSMSRALRDFSLHVVHEIVEKDHLGKLVYAGGDDVLAFVNLRDLLDVMRKLRAYFSGSLKINDGVVAIDFSNGSGYIPVDDKGEPINTDSRKNIDGFLLSMGTKATASMGVVIAHYSDNLSSVLARARECEKEAKSIDGKNAFSIALSKRAGGTERSVAKWYYGEDFFESITVIEKWADAIAREFISRKFVYILKDVSETLDELESKAVFYELLRQAKRQRNKGAKGFKKEIIEDLIKSIVNLKGRGMKLIEIAGLLSVAEFLGREENR